MSDELFASDTEDSTFPTSLSSTSQKGVSSVPSMNGARDALEFEVNSQIVPNSLLEDEEEDNIAQIPDNPLLMDSLGSESSMSVEPEVVMTVKTSAARPRPNQYSRRVPANIMNSDHNSQIATNSLLQDTQTDTEYRPPQAGKPVAQQLHQPMFDGDDYEDMDMETMYAEMEMASMMQNTHAYEEIDEDIDALLAESLASEEQAAKVLKSPLKPIEAPNIVQAPMQAPVVVSPPVIRKTIARMNVDDTDRVLSIFSSLYYKPFSQKSSLHVNFPFPKIAQDANEEEDLRYAEHNLRLKSIPSASAFRSAASIQNNLEEEEELVDEEEELAYRIVRKPLPLQAHCMKHPRVLSKMGKEGKYMGIHTEKSHGYVLLEPEIWKEKRLLSRMDECKKGGVDTPLLDIPVAMLLSEVEKENIQMAMDRSIVAMEPVVTTDVPRKKKKHTTQENLLYVDKYAPKGYLDLVSHETVNLDAMTWLSQWNIPVFHHAKGTFATEEERLHFRKLREQQEQGKAAVVDQSLVLNGPKQKILMLHGPAGTGKTTLANIIAKHCGYRAVEINASDDRSAKALVPRITNALENHHILGKEPVCLILDEIDGVMGGDDDTASISASSAGAIQLLVKYAQQAKLNFENPEQGKAMNRPIICICNDIQAAALRPLLPYAKQLHVSGVDNDSLLQRIAHVCNTEKIPCPGHVQRALVQISQGDMRSCLHNLQFIKFSAKKLNVDDITKLSIGEKDSIRSAQFLYDRFLQPLPRKVSDTAKYQQQMQETVDQITDSLLLDRVFDGVYYNLYGTTMVDQHGYKMQHCLDLLSMGNQFTKRHLDDYASYIPAELQLTCMPTRKLVTQPPRFLSQQDQAMQRNYVMVNTFLHKSNFLSRKFITAREFVLNLSTCIVDLLVPRVDTPALHMFKEQQWTEFKRVVRLMAACELKYTKHYATSTYGENKTRFLQHDNNFAAFEWKLDPPIAELHKFNYSHDVESYGITVKANKSSFFGFNINAPINHSNYQKFKQYGANQVYSDTWTNQRRIMDILVEPLNQEVLYEQMRTKNIQEEMKNATSSSNNKNKSSNPMVTQAQPTVPTKTLHTKPQVVAFPVPSVTENLAEELKPAKKPVQAAISSFIQKKRKEPVHPVGAALEDTPAVPSKRPNVIGSRSNHTLHFAFIEGFSDAVKKPVKMSHFLDL